MNVAEPFASAPALSAGQRGRICTRTPWQLRQGQAEADVKAMQARCKKSEGGSTTPHVLALPDAYNNAVTQKNQFDEALLEVL